MADFRVNNPVFQELSLGSFDILGKMQNITANKILTEKKAGQEVRLPATLDEQRNLYRLAFEGEQEKLINDVNTRLEFGLEGSFGLFGGSIADKNAAENWKKAHKDDKDLPKQSDISLFSKDQFNNFAMSLRKEVEKEVYNRDNKEYVNVDHIVDEAKVKSLVTSRLKGSGILDNEGYLTNINGKRVYTGDDQKLNDQIVQELTYQTISSMQEAYDIELVRALLSSKWDPADKDSWTANNKNMPGNIGLQGGSAKQIFESMSQLYSHDGDIKGKDGKPGNANQITEKDYLAGQLGYAQEFINNNIEKNSLGRLDDVHNSVKQRKTSKDIGMHPIFMDKANRNNQPLPPRNLDEQRREYIVAASDMLDNETAFYKKHLLQDLKTNNDRYHLGYKEEDMNNFANDITMLILEEGRKGPQDKKSPQEEKKTITDKVATLVRKHNLNVESGNKDISMERFVASVSNNVANESSNGFGSLAELLTALGNKPLWDRVGTAMSHNYYQDNEKIITDYDIDTTISKHKGDVSPGEDGLLEKAGEMWADAKDGTVKFFNKLFNRTDAVDRDAPAARVDETPNITIQPEAKTEKEEENKPPEVTTESPKLDNKSVEIPGTGKEDRGMIDLLFGKDDNKGVQLPQVADPSMQTEIKADAAGGYVEIYDNPVTNYGYDGGKVAAEENDRFLGAVTKAKYEIIHEAQQRVQEKKEMLEGLKSSTNKKRQQAQGTDFWKYNS